MSYTICPVTIEIYDSVNDLVAKVEAFDEACSKVDVIQVTSPHDWPQLSASIQKALEQINPEKEEVKT